MGVKKGEFYHMASLIIWLSDPHYVPFIKGTGLLLYNCSGKEPLSDISLPFISYWIGNKFHGSRDGRSTNDLGLAMDVYPIDKTEFNDVALVCSGQM